MKGTQQGNTSNFCLYGRHELYVHTCLYKVSIFDQISCSPFITQISFHVFISIFLPVVVEVKILFLFKTLLIYCLLDFIVQRWRGCLFVDLCVVREPGSLRCPRVWCDTCDRCRLSTHVDQLQQENGTKCKVKTESEHHY